MTPYGPDTIVQRGDVLWRSVVDGVLIRRRGNDEEVLLAGTGVALWHELAVGLPFDELTRRLADAYGTTPDRVVADIKPVLDDLLAQSVVARV